MLRPLLRARPALLAAHRWLGLAVGSLILLQGLTGAVTAFRHELDRLADPAAMIVAPGRPPAPLAAVAKALKTAAPDARLARLDFPARPGETYFARLQGPHGLRLASVDPSTARVLRIGGLGDWPAEAVYQLHYSLAAGDGGERVVGAVGLAALLMAVTGPLVWWPGLGRIRQGLSVTRGAGAWRTARDAHRLAGVGAGLFLAVTAFTGLNMAWKPWLKPALAAVAPMRPTPPAAPASGRCRAPAPLDALVAVARAQRNGEPVRDLRFQGKGGLRIQVDLAPPAVRPMAADQVWLDACSGTVLAVRIAADDPPGEAFYGWLLPLHSGAWAGLAGRSFQALVGLALAALAGLGYAQWIARRARARTRRPAAVRGPGPGDRKGSGSRP